MQSITRQLRRFDGTGYYARVIQDCGHRLSKLTITEPLLVRVLQGCKMIIANQKQYLISSGQLLVIPAGITIDVINQNRDNQIYMADCFAWSEQILNNYQTQSLTKNHNAINMINVISSPMGTFHQAIDYLLNMLQTPSIDLRLINHQFNQLLLCLELENIGLPVPHNNQLSFNISKMVTCSSPQKWQAAAIAKHFAMSESTLRRHLAQQGHSLSNIIFEARMKKGLTLLQTSHLTITQIAHEMGYSSGSRFAHYFRKRFGFSPSEMRR